MNCHADEIKELAVGNDWFFGNIKAFKRAKMGLVTYLSDQPETCLLLKEQRLGKFGL